MRSVKSEPRTTDKEPGQEQWITADICSGYKNSGPHFGHVMDKAATSLLLYPVFNTIDDGIAITAGDVKKRPPQKKDSRLDFKFTGCAGGRVSHAIDPGNKTKIKQGADDHWAGMKLFFFARLGFK